MCCFSHINTYRYTSYLVNNQALLPSLQEKNVKILKLLTFSEKKLLPSNEDIQITNFF